MMAQQGNCLENMRTTASAGSYYDWEQRSCALLAARRNPIFGDFVASTAVMTVMPGKVLGIGQKVKRSLPSRSSSVLCF